MQSPTMQPPPPRSSPGDGSTTGAPLSGGAHNVFRRNAPYRRPNTPLSGAPATLPLPPVTDPFGLGQQMQVNSSPSLQNAVNGGLPNLNRLAGSQLPWPTDGMPCALGERREPYGAPAPLPPAPRFGEAGQFSPAAPLQGAEAGQALPQEPSYFHTGLGSESSEMGQARPVARNPHGQEGGQETHSFPPAPPTFLPQFQQSSSQWAVSHGSRPPSVQNYFQPSDPQTQGFGGYCAPQPVPLQQSHAAGSHYQQHHSPSLESQVQFLGAEHQDIAQPSPFPQLPQHQQHFSGTGFVQSEDWQSGPPREVCQQQAIPHSGHQADCPAPRSDPPPGDSEPGTISMFFKGGEVENKETLVSEQSSAVSASIGEAFQPSTGPFFSAQPLPELCTGNAEPRGLGPQPPVPCGVYSISSGEPGGAVDSTQPHDGGLVLEDDENSEFVQNQEVLPTEPDRTPVAFQPMPGLVNQGLHAIRNVSGAGPPPNLETPDPAHHPLRCDSISSNHSSASHSSGSSLRRSHAQTNTFIQQESGKPPTDSLNRFFEQIDSSPLSRDPLHPGREADSAGRPLYYSQLSQSPALSSPKPMTTFQASANSSFEPVRSHGQLPVKPVEVDQAKMVMELNQSTVTTVGQRHGAGTSDISPGNLEQPPDNLENIRMPQPHSNLYAGVGTSKSVARPVPEESHKRPSSRVSGIWVKSESPAATLWAQSELPSFSAGIMLAPAAPAVSAAAKLEVIQPPEDSSKGLSYPVPPGNMENPPQVAEDRAQKKQTAPSYATLLVPTPASPTPAVLLARPLQTSPHIPSPECPLRDRGDGQSAAFASPVPPNPELVTTVQGASHAQAPLNLAANSRITPRMGSEGQSVDPAITTSPPPSQDPGVIVTSPTSNLQPSSDSGKDEMRNRAFDQPNPSINCELLDFTLHSTVPNQPLTSMNPAVSLPLGSTSQQSVPCHTYTTGLYMNDKAGFYLQVTADVQQQQPITTVSGQQAVPPLPPVTHDQRQPGSLPVSGQCPSVSFGYPGSGPTQPPAQEQHLPTQAAVTTAAAPQHPTHHDVMPQHPYPPGQPHAGYGYAYPYMCQDYGADPQQPYVMPYSSYPTLDPRVGQQMSYPLTDSRGNHSYYQDDPYRRYARYGRYDVNNMSYKESEREKTSRPSSRASQSSNRPTSRQGCTEDLYGGRSGREGYPGYYPDYYNSQYQYRDSAHWDRYDPAAYDPRYRDYREYEMPYWYYGPYRELYTDRRNGFENLWHYDPRYDVSFDEGSRQDLYPDEFDGHSTHSEQSVHSALSSHSVRSRRSSFGSRSQQSQIYRSQQDLTVEAPAHAASTDYTYGQYSQSTVHPGYSDYQYRYPTETDWQPLEKAPPRPVTPEKFTVPHLCVRFSPGGQLLKVLPNLPSEGQPALVELHSLEMILQHMPEQEDLKKFPGPLVKEETHKVDVISFAQNKATECLRNDELLDKESASLLWELIVLLCRQNGTVIGTDIAELLLREHRSVWLPGKSPNEANLIDFNNDLVPRAEDESCLFTDSFLDGNTTENPAKDTERFRELLLFGRKKDALESAMKHGLWGHALLLASKMDSRTHAKVMTRFANSLPINDPLQTVYQLMSGRMPAAATCCGDERWGDWRPHLAMVLSNLSNGPDLDRKTITTMGDTLATKGLLDASHFCYLMAQVGFGVYTRKTTKLVLIGSNHSWSFLKFASNGAIQRTEAYEYAQALGNQVCFLPNFQVFKFIYACRLAEMGLAAQAFHYCEVIARTVLKNPVYYSAVFLSQLIQISTRLRFFDPQLKERSEQELHVEPDWIKHLRQIENQLKDGALVCRSGRTTPQPFCSSTPSSEYDQVSQSDGQVAGSHEEALGMDNPLMTSFTADTGMPGMAGVQLMPPAPPHAVLDGRPTAAPPLQPMMDSGIPMYSPTQASPGFPGQSPHSAFKQTFEPAKGPLSTAPPGSPLGLPSEILQTVPEQQVPENTECNSVNHQMSPKRSSFGESGHQDFYDHMVKMASGRRSRSTSQSSLHMPYGRRSRTTSESSVHSMGRERHPSAANQSTLPPPSETIANTAPETKKEPRRKEPETKKGGWLSWLRPSKKTEAHLPDDKNKSIVWDEKKQRWVNLNEPEEESKPLPPPPSFPVTAPTPASSSTPSAAPAPSGGPPPRNRFSMKAGTKGRYVDVLNPSGSRPGGVLMPPVDLFAPLAPMPIPTNLFVPMPGEGSQPPEGNPAEISQPVEQANLEATAQPQIFNPIPNADSSPSEPVSLQHGETAAQPVHGGPASGAVPFYNPAQFPQPSAGTSGSRPGRFGQRKYPTLN
ncbi:protein transport protein Sec16A isoform X1 [Chiloscyllium plagiosum]|uniref:protein transport protein Sec16A isoform X1 n=1 Tax=Chiloscyllium plagiosum TaxID=36176 RepID=UPI001CB81A6C|nr:protein transport protein Sec16A isoform X1 [Chiloscyllium plagiosum]XP_043576571.1 protein transport protein Sec16A isoform X1 [Chiloscyllium plagiosum]XP_043576572.1 protein transport protein Sec16A isoform X1 [Chiloscyllium plagiosum]XP_043576573.1 protein transport protein Sec16A isoform X1 [Chiloscyllium plagiosum]XP_043576574.1 protein transport protein Sec16A isoform X1 [Chiloscyllium plagiosum]